MKKKLITMLAMMCVGLFVGCGSDKVVPLNEMDLEKYVTVGDYQNLSVTIDDTSVDQEEWDTLVEQVYMDNVTADNGGITDRAVEDGDTVDIAFEGKLDGVAFDGGTAETYRLTVGSHSFIEGFEEGLLGVMPGETLDLNLTFPDPYTNADLAGQEVVFTVTVHYIVPTDMQDSVVASFGAAEFSNIEELRQYVYDYLDYYAQNDYVVNSQNAILEGFMNICTFQEIPEQMIEEYGSNIRQEMELEAESVGTDADTYTNYYYG
ncbi:FKBP-type peptidyl-prolyl cis-trans isomerase, partial [Lachnospiraceae bacterium OttesenSCG-928-D06]|nr:FKBP-type peptidyl-prolyl cis-trans isomerase [Lachnospiraceae bacterium OttesenSCG-928-D06]